MTPTILLAANEADPFSAETVRQNRIRLTKRMFDEGWHVLSATSKEQLLAKITSDQDVTAIVLDGTGRINTQDYSDSGLRSLRDLTDAPILIITDSSDERSDLDILNSGIDGFLHQPVSDSMIIAYMKNLLKRTGAFVRKKIEYGGLYINQSEHTVEADGIPVTLTPKEFELLFYFAQNPNLALTRYQILKNAWGSSYDGSERTVDSHVKSLRGKLGKMGNHILTIRSVGYKFTYDKPVEAEKSV